MTSFAKPALTQDEVTMNRARFLIEQAFTQDEAGHTDDAFELYAQAAEICLELVF